MTGSKKVVKIIFEKGFKLYFQVYVLDMLEVLYEVRRRRHSLNVREKVQSWAQRRGTELNNATRSVHFVFDTGQAHAQ